MRLCELSQNWRTAVAAASIAVTFNLIGCGGGTGPVVPTKSSDAAQKLTGIDQIKERLKMIAETGAGGSSVSGMRAGLEELKATNATLAADLIKDMEALEKLQDPAKVKALAFKMLDKVSK
ncbi:MAG: hypothetical protein WCH39_24160 [Schlesneria sp.]